jgi:DNA-binding NtrC family response regulator
MADITLPVRLARTPALLGATWRGREAQPPFSLIVGCCPDATIGDRFRISVGATCIGREPDGLADRVLVVDDPRVSRCHARLTCARDELLISDERSRNGLFVNGRRVEQQTLGVGDVVRLGDTVLLVGRGGAGDSDDDDDALEIVGRSPVLRELRLTIERVAPSELPVVVVGATGTGKDLVVRALHARSGRRGPLLAVNCAALPGTLVENALFGHKKGSYTGATSAEDGAFARAREGTLFLDEIGDLSLEAQPKLLRALENREVTPIGAVEPVATDVRVVVATHVPLEAAMKEGKFREDLYARLAGVVIKVPTLAERKEDVLLLLQRFLPADLRDRPMTADFVESLLAYHWPRNVRELQKLAERLPVLHPDAPCWHVTMLDDDMRLFARGERAVEPEPPRGPPSREELIALLERCGGNVARVARLAQRSRKQIYRWMDRHCIARGAGRPI